MRWPFSSSRVLPGHQNYALGLSSERAFLLSPSWIRVVLASPNYFAKLGRNREKKAASDQSLTNSVLNPPSPELWRKRPPENRLRPLAGNRSAELLARMPAIIGL